MQRIKPFLIQLVNFMFLIVMFFSAVVGIKEYMMMPFQVQGHSMESTLKDGERMLLLRLAKIERFDVVVLPDPRGSRVNYVKRLIGLPGDTLYVKDDVLYLNGIAIDEPYLQEAKKEYSGVFTEDFSLYDTVGLEVIPEGYGFVLGDNRPFSGDSREFGLVPLSSIEGEANFVFSPSANARKLVHYTLE